MKQEDKKYGIFILQETNLGDMIRMATGPKDKWRIIYCTIKDKKWKQLYHCDSWDKIENRFNDYVKMLEWKRQQQ